MGNQKADPALVTIVLILILLVAAKYIDRPADGGHSQSGEALAQHQVRRPDAAHRIRRKTSDAAVNQSRREPFRLS
jgi:hypothetical protein